MEFLYLIFYACLRLWFLNVETNPGLWRPVPALCGILCSNVLGLAGNLSDLTVALSRYDILFCSETLDSDMCHVSELLVPGFGRPVLLCQCKMPRAHGVAAYVRDGYGAFRQHKFECGCCEMLVFSICGVRPNFYVYSLYHNSQPSPRWPDLWLFTCINGCCEGWGCPCLFPVCGWSECPSSGLQEWFGSMTTNCHGVAAFDFTTVSGCDQLVVSWTHALGGTLDLLMTDVPDLVWVSVVAPIGNSDHSSLLAVISMAQAVPNLCVSRKVFLKH